MINAIERRLSNFVDRTAEMRLFNEFLKAGEKPIMVVCGDGGVGKTLLMDYMICECEKRKLCAVKVEWTNQRNYDYKWLMRNIRDKVGSDRFKRFTDLINYFTVPGYNLNICSSDYISVADGAKFNSTKTRDIAGVIIKDSMLIIPRSDLNVTEMERMAQLTDQFIQDLSEALGEKSLVFFFDATEKMTRYTHKWVWGELLRIVADGRLHNIRIVLFRRKHLKLDKDIKRAVVEVNLKPLKLKDIIDYLAKFGVDESLRPCIADVLLSATKGNPLEIAIIVEDFLLEWEKRRHENE